MSSLYDFKSKTVDGVRVDFGAFKEKVLLVTNVASR